MCMHAHTKNWQVVSEDKPLEEETWKIYYKPDLKVYNKATVIEKVK